MSEDRSTYRRQGFGNELERGWPVARGRIVFASGKA